MLYLQFYFVSVIAIIICFAVPVGKYAGHIPYNAPSRTWCTEAPVHR